ncbi:hypothetical protein VB715_21000 [Crocosphaera sp. UHCC 0190]|nr:hypothetical protein [Crocosphaera sp. UHCC 0190]MEA5512253.1 hypothetical protein [Crocosphaera sp. UHCC 0190]
MPKNNSTTLQNNQFTQSEEQEFEKRYQEWLETQILRQDSRGFYQ